MADRLSFDILANDSASANITRVGKSMKSMTADVELANVRLAKATLAADAAVERFGRDSLQAREALARLAKAEDAVESTTRRLTAAQERAAAAVQDSADEAEQAVSKWDGLKTAGAAAGAGAAAAVGAGFLANMSIEAGQAKLAAQLGLTEEQSATAGRIAGDVYGANFGDSMESVNEAVRVVWNGMQSLGEGAPGQIEKATQAALLLSETFEVDVTESMKAAATMVKTGLARNSTEAFDIIAKGFQKGLNSSDDLLDTLNEYSVQFQKLGLSGGDALSLLSQGLKAGALDTDKIADAVAEFTKLALDGNANTAAGFRSLGLDARNTAAVIASGGPAARDTFAQILTALSSVKDPLKQNAIGLQLFGTMWEDLGPQVVTSLSLADNAIGNTSGAIDGMSEALGGTGAAQLETWRRRLEGLVQSAAEAPGVLGATAAGVAVMGPSALDAAGNLGMMAAGLRGVSMGGPKAATALRAVGVAAAALAGMAAIDSVVNALKDPPPGLNTTVKALQELQATGKGTGPVLDNIGDAFKDLGEGVAGARGVLEKIPGFFNLAERATGSWTQSIQESKDQVTQLDQALALEVQSGNAEAAAAQFAQLTDMATKQGLSVDELTKLMPNYRDAVDAAGLASTLQAGSVNQSTDALGRQKKALDESTAAANENANAMLMLSDGEVAYWASVDGAAAALKKNGAGLKANTQAGRENITALSGMARESRDYLQLLKDQGAPQTTINGQLEQSRKRLYDQARAFGKSKDEARAYVDMMLKIPPKADTKATFDKAAATAGVASHKQFLNTVPDWVSTLFKVDKNTATSNTSLYKGFLNTVPTGIGTIFRADKGAAQSGAQSYTGTLRGVPNSVYTRATFDISGAMANRNRWMGALGSLPSGIPSSIRARAGGGILPGSPSRRDNMLIAAASGEYVVNAEQTSRHLAVLEAINSGRYRGFASGGYVPPLAVGVAAGGAAAVTLNVYAPIGSQAQLEGWLQSAVTNLQRKGRL